LCHGGKKNVRTKCGRAGSPPRSPPLPGLTIGLRGPDLASRAALESQKEGSSSWDMERRRRKHTQICCQASQNGLQATAMGAQGGTRAARPATSKKKNFLTTAAQKLPNGAVGTEIRKISIKRCGHHVATVGAPENCCSAKKLFSLQQLLLLLLLLLCFEILRTL